MASPLSSTATLALSLLHWQKQHPEHPFSFNLRHSASGNEVHITVEGREELPIYVTIAEPEVLCLLHLFHENEVQDGKINELNSLLLSMNIPLPLSAFARIDGRYVLYGELSTNSAVEDLALELQTLSDNALEALETLQTYLK
jgi:uncharacterized protein